MDDHGKQLATQWAWQNLTLETMQETATWLAGRRQLGSGCERFFHMAGKLLLLARFDYSLITPVFFHAVIGLERGLRIHYKSPDQTYTSGSDGNLDGFRNLFQKAVDEAVITDELFGEVASLTEFFPEYMQDVEMPSNRCAALALLIPELRNRYFHGKEVLAPEFYWLTIQLRQCADALQTRGTKSLLE